MLDISIIITIIENICRMVHGFLFHPDMSTTIGLTRILIGAAYIAILLEYKTRQTEYLGKTSIANTLPCRQTRFSQYLFWDNCTTGMIINFAIFVDMLFILGFYSNFCAFLLFMIANAFYERNYLIENGGHLQIRIMFLLLIFSRCGDALSIDSLISGRSLLGTMGEPWSDRAIQIFIALIYYKSVTAKMMISPDRCWWKGKVISFALNSQDFGRWSNYITVPRSLCILGSYYTLIAQNALVYLVWFKQTRYISLSLVALSHIMMIIGMKLGNFPFVTLACLSIFIPSNDLAEFLSRFIP